MKITHENDSVTEKSRGDAHRTSHIRH